MKRSIIFLVSLAVANMSMFCFGCKKPAEDFLTVETTQLVFSVSASSQTVACSSNAAINAVSSQPEWCTATVREDGKSIVVRVKKNDAIVANSDRTSTITVTAGKAEAVQINVKQTSEDAKFVVLADDEMIFSGISNQRTFTVQTNVPYTVDSSDKSWCTVEYSQSPVLENVTIFVKDNLTKVEREAVITIAADGFKKVEIKIIQRYSEIKPVSFPGIGELEISKLTSFINQTKSNANQTTGIILSPYYMVEAEGEPVPVYAVPMYEGPTTHSFSTIMVPENLFPIKLKLTVTFSAGKVTVLPESHGVNATLSGKTVEMDIPAFGSYSFVFDEKQDNVFTLFVNKQTEFIPPVGYKVVTMKPGSYGDITAESNTVLYFEKGYYAIDKIRTSSNVTIYFEPGAFIDAKMPTPLTETPILMSDWAGKTIWHAFFLAAGVENVKILGAALIDFTRLDFHARGGFHFETCSNIEIDGPILNNAATWTTTIARCTNVSVRNHVVFGYRQNSDGINLCSCNGAVVEDCFVRTGDDCYCVKSIGGSVKCENILFRNNVAWPDRCRAMGIVYETEIDITNVRFEHCSVGFAPPEWSEEMGALVVNVANPSKVSEIYFDDIEIYSVKKYPINLHLHTSSGKIQNIRFNNIRFKSGTQIRIYVPAGAATAIDRIYFNDIFISGARATSLTDLNLKLTNVTNSIVYLNQ